MRIIKGVQLCLGRSKAHHRLLLPSHQHNNLFRHNSSDVRWLWKANKDVQEFYRANLQCTRIGTMVFTLNTTKPLETRHFIQVLEALQRKTPHLQACLRFRGDDLWFCKPENVKLDFEILEEGVETGDAIVKAIKRFANPETTTWFTLVRFIPHCVESPAQEGKPSHPFQYEIAYSGHHGFMDGLGASYTLKCFVHLLADVITGRSISNDEYGPFYDDQQIPMLIDRIKEELTNSPNLIDQVKSTLPSPDQVPIFFQAFPRPKESNPTTRDVGRILEAHLFKKFLLKCKAEGVTFNSALVSVINTAIMDLIRQKGIYLDSYNIAGIIVTSYRRYMKPSPNFYYGPCAGPFSYVSSLDTNVKQNFWEYSKKVNDELTNGLKSGVPLKQKALQELNGVNLLPFDYVSRLPPALHDYSMTNLGDVTSMLENDLVKVTKLKSMNQVQKSFHSSFHQVMRLNDCMHYNISYVTDYFTEETANLILDQIFSVIESVTPKI